MYVQFYDSVPPQVSNDSHALRASDNTTTVWQMFGIEEKVDGNVTRGRDLPSERGQQPHLPAIGTRVAGLINVNLRRFINE